MVSYTLCFTRVSLDAYARPFFILQGPKLRTIFSRENDDFWFSTQEGFMMDIKSIRVLQEGVETKFVQEGVEIMFHASKRAWKPSLELAKSSIHFTFVVIFYNRGSKSSRF